MTPQKTTDSPTAPTPRFWSGTLLTLAIAALVSTGWWFGVGYFQSNDELSPKVHQMTPVQHTSHLVRVMRISAAADITPETVESIPLAAADVEVLECGTRYAQRIQESVEALHAVEYVSTVAGSRQLATGLWRAQQSSAHDATAALRGLLPADCVPHVPVTYQLDESVRFAPQGTPPSTMLAMSEDLLDTWTELYLLADTPQQRRLATAGLWQVTSWEDSWSPGRSPFTFVQ